ncbi:uncharacterized protein N0V89_004182 [Didymosphaeria variabile]|uniref:Uncharacterized protein n=1 Tax=Didymosphaeria variabile TaxID=1932322 RepID=A0A9W8XPX9_9PLEO|nr:uncharacterized protein N0V89_004182 [Didymosphaeria variabile]KAJ4356152.1 hypothetical protein N0V89_004182 [Didymosphaeria variabile]
MEVIPVGQDGWNENIRQATLDIQETAPTTPQLEPTMIGDVAPTCTIQQSDSELAAPNGTTLGYPPTPPHTPPSSFRSVEPMTASHITINPSADALSTPLYLPSLPRTPPLGFTAHPPPRDMSPSAKLICLFRWTHFSPITSAPYLSRSPREKNFSMSWSDSGATDAVLAQWVKEMWWGVWVRQAHVNYVGMWKRRFEKEDRKAKEAKAEKEKAKVGMKMKEKAQMELDGRKTKILERLRVINGC